MGDEGAFLLLDGKGAAAVRQVHLAVRLGRVGRDVALELFLARAAGVALAGALDGLGASKAAGNCRAEKRTKGGQDQGNKHPRGQAKRRRGGGNDQVDPAFHYQRLDQGRADRQTAQTEQRAEPQGDHRRKQRVRGDRLGLCRLAFLLGHLRNFPVNQSLGSFTRRCSGSGGNAPIH